MVYMTMAQCEAQGGACPRICLDMTPAEVQCATNCYDGCYCAPGFYLLNGSCVPRAECPCYHQGELHKAGASLPLDTCNNWYEKPAGRVLFQLDSLQNGSTLSSWPYVCETVPAIMEKWCVAQGLALVSSCISHRSIFSHPSFSFRTVILNEFFSFSFPVDCGWSSWTQWSACSRSCDVGVRRRYRSGTNPPAAFGGRRCIGDKVGIDTCSIEPCFGEPLELPFSFFGKDCHQKVRKKSE